MDKIAKKHTTEKDTSLRYEVRINKTNPYATKQSKPTLYWRFWRLNEKTAALFIDSNNMNASDKRFLQHEEDIFEVLTERSA